MHATIRIYNQPDVANDLAAHSEQIQQLMAQVDGLQWYCLFRTDAGCASVSVCDTERAAEDSTDAADESKADRPEGEELGDEPLMSADGEADLESLASEEASE